MGFAIAQRALCWRNRGYQIAVFMPGGYDILCEECSTKQTSYKDVRKREHWNTKKAVKVGATSGSDIDDKRTWAFHRKYSKWKMERVINGGSVSGKQIYPEQNARQQ